MVIKPFENSDYEVLVSDLISDIYYSEISVSSRIVLLRKLTELISRRFLNLGMGEKMELGDITSPIKNPKYKTTVRLNNVDKVLREDFEKTVNELREIGNKHSHTKNHIIANQEEWIKSESLICDLFSYLFVQYFLDYNLDLKSDKNVVSMFSLLPPEIRFRTLQKLLDIKGFDNVLLLDKYMLSLVKSRSWCEAYEWLISNRDKISGMFYPTEEQIIDYLEGFSEDELPLKLREYQNVFELLASKLQSPEIKSVSGGVYKTFEQAARAYSVNMLVCYLSDTIEQIKFKELLYFCFIGRGDIVI